MTAHLFTTWFTEYFKPTVESYCPEIKDYFQNITAHRQCTWSPRALIEMWNETKGVFKPADTASILQATDQGIISACKSYYLRNTFHKSVATIDWGFL